jgi:hypothetical protein
MKELKMKVTQGIRIGGETINALRFTDDIAFCAETEEDLQNILNNVNKILKKKNTKIIECSRTNPTQLDIKIDNTHIEQI